ncbi:MAG: universal stress protein [Bacteroidales bacterium]|nr:universal stress protein [Bacteroidales bacterium]
MTEKDTILVPWDFTQVAVHALQYAILIANKVENNIAFVHIVKREADIEPARQKLVEQTKDMLAQGNFNPVYIIKEGTIFTTIGEVADELGANLVVMGTHGIKGMQKLLGSWALKVIASSKVPFIIVQDKPVNTTFEKIVVPLNFKRENKENAPWLNYLSKYYKSMFYILKDKTTDTRLHKGVESNVFFIRKYFESKGIDFEITDGEGKKDFAKETVEYAAQIKADLILIMTTKGIGFSDYVLGANEQFIIANSVGIPVMCINPRPPRNVGGFRTAAG